MSDPIQVRCCRFCHCTDEDPCTLPTGDPCAWVTKIADRCNNPRCLAAFAAECRKALRETNELIRKARMAPYPGQIHRARLAAMRGKRGKKRAA